MKKQDTRCYHEGNFKHGCTDETTKVNPKKNEFKIIFLKIQFP